VTRAPARAAQLHKELDTEGRRHPIERHKRWSDRSRFEPGNHRLRRIHALGELALAEPDSLALAADRSTDLVGAACPFVGFTGRGILQPSLPHLFVCRSLNHCPGPLSCAALAGSAPSPVWHARSRGIPSELARVGFAEMHALFREQVDVERDVAEIFIIKSLQPLSHLRLKFDRTPSHSNDAMDPM